VVAVRTSVRPPDVERLPADGGLRRFRGLVSTMRIEDVTHDDVPTAAPDTTVGDLTRAMRERGADTAVVLEEGEPVGLVTLADVGRAFTSGEELSDRTVADIHAEDPVTVRADADLPALVAEFDATGARTALVVDDDEYVGVVTLGDALVAYGEELTEVLALFDRPD